MKICHYVDASKGEGKVNGEVTDYESYTESSCWQDALL